jgi:hypothetical protein
MKWRQVVAVFVGVALAGATLTAAGGEAPPRIPTVTRLVKLFLDREAQLGDAVRAGDNASIERLLTGDFELRMGARAGQPVPRADFVRALVATRDPGGEISAMAVHDLGTTMVVSYAQGHRGGPLFIVDVWRNDGGDWKLAIRYTAPAGDARMPIPGAGAPEPEIPKKY